MEKTSGTTDEDEEMVDEGVAAVHGAAIDAEVVPVVSSPHSPGGTDTELDLVAEIDGERKEVTVPWGGIRLDELGFSPADDVPGTADADRLLRYFNSINVEIDLPDGDVIELYRKGGRWRADRFDGGTETDAEILFERR